MKRLLIMFACLMPIALAHAASFDCAKAGIKIEKLICGDAEISKLDEELNVAYKAALQNEKQADTVKQAQKQWMKERNGCSDAVCVKDAYVARLAALRSSIGGNYTLVMSNDVKLCKAMLALYNEDMKAYKRIRYDQHEMFTNIEWKADDESELAHAFFDINNDGKNELVIKYVNMLRGYDIDNLLIYPADSDIFSKLKPGAGGLHTLSDNQNHLFSSGNQIYLLKDLPKTPEVAWVGGRFVLQPFVWEGTSYISMTDLTPRWVVIAKYKQAAEMQDICYFFNPSIEHQRY